MGDLADSQGMLGTWPAQSSPTPTAVVGPPPTFLPLQGHKMVPDEPRKKKSGQHSVVFVDTDVGGADVNERNPSANQQQSYIAAVGGGRTTLSTDATGVEISNWFDLLRKCYVEFLGDLIFVFVGSLAGGTILNVALAHGVCISVLIIAFGHISGGHFNPAVTLGVVLSGVLQVKIAICYVVAQLFGGFCGALLVRLTLPYEKYLEFHGGSKMFDETKVSWVNAIVCEIILTNFLVSVVLNSAVDSAGSNIMAALAIGLTITVNILAGGDISGACMNPSRSFGTGISDAIFNGRSEQFSQMHFYWLGPILGSIFASIVYKLILAKNENRWRPFQFIKKTAVNKWNTAERKITPAPIVSIPEIKGPIPPPAY